MLINLTPHTINFFNESGTMFHSVEPEAVPARVSCKTVQIGYRDGLPVTTTEYSEVTGLPEPKEGVAYIVSALVAQRVPERDDIYIPNEAVRDEQGRIIGCRSLGRIGG